jgi:Txe/YoeB family toxin of Txe-Axe toxin-antitoxin module
MKSFRERPEYQEWKKVVKERYDNTCLLCKHEGNIHVHHIKPVVAYPELVFDVDNGVTLCGNCHAEYNNREDDLEQILAPKLLEFARLEELNIEQQLKEIHEKRNQIFDLMLAMEDLKLETNRFGSQYAATVGKLYAEMDKVNLEIKEYTLRIQLIEKEAIVNKAIIDARVEEFFKEEQQKVFEHEQKEKVFEHEQKAASEPEIGTTLQEQLKQLHRKLVRTFHPDKVKDVTERDKKHRMMVLINQSFEKNDLSTLQKLYDIVGDSEENDKVSLSDVKSWEKMQLLREESQRLDKIIADLDKELKDNGLYKLKTKREDILVGLAGDVKRKIDAQRRRLEDLKQRFQRLSKLLRLEQQ